ncbi:MAG: glycosyltransferase, partial [Myxococcota bacterium]|nr:glycosyltransferase [Myxococcota bacterium]
MLLLNLAAIPLAGLCVLGAHRAWLALRWRKHPIDPVGPPPRDLEPESTPVVTVQVPLFNERAVATRVIDAVCGLDWPLESLEIQILDDSNDDTTDLARAQARVWRARGLDVQVHHRVTRNGYKAGALAQGLDQARGTLVAIFDADFVPSPDFLRQVVPFFEHDSRLGMVQARWGHLNREESSLTRIQALLLDGHFVIEHTVRHDTGRFFNFNGTAGIWRRSCILDAGGWQHDTLTEDLDLSYRAQLAGWRFLYLPHLVVSAEVPGTFRAFKSQQFRWAKGALQTARKVLPRVMTAPLPWRTRLEAVFHLCGNLAYPLVLLLALVLPWATLVRMERQDPFWWLLDTAVLVLATGSVLLFYGTAARGAGQSSSLGRNLALMGVGIGLAVNQTRAVLEALFGHPSEFVRTAKQGTPSDGNAPAVRPYRHDRDWTSMVELLLFAYELTWLFL